MRKLVTLFIFAVLVVSQLSAQTRLIKGKVTDEKGSPVENASVTVKGASQGSNTDAAGNFSLNVPTSAKTLVFASLNFEKVEVAVGNKTTINVVLKSNTQSLQDVVVVGYGTKKKSDLTGSVTTLKGAEIESKPFTSVDKALQGKVAGLQSVASSGQPGASQAILIRGVSSITASTSPLWVVDGVPVNSGDASRLQTTANLLSTLNPNDIESITVLKDAASQSIYGSRAANGVIVVTTKKGKAGVTKYRFDSEVGTSQTAYTNPKYRPLDVNEYMDVTGQGYLNAGYTAAQTQTQLNALGFGNGTDYNWLNNVTRVGQQQQYNLSAEGGNDKTTFFMSGGRFTQEGTTINSQFARTNGNIRLTHKATDRLTLNVNFNGGYVNQRAPLNGGAFGNPVLSSYFMLPSRSPYNADGSWNFNLGGLHNTIALAQLDKRYLRQASLRGNMSAEYRILDNLRLKTSYGLDYNTEEEDQYNNPLHGDGAATNGRAFAYYTRYFNYISTTTLDYQQNLTKNGDLSSNFQLGYEGQKSQGYFTSLQSQQFPPTLALTYPASGASPITASAYTSDYTFASEFASGSINYQNRFVVSGSFRRDGSSRFSADNRYGNFWSVGGTWNLDKEKFIQKLNFFTQLKLRSSYGVNGNAGIGNYDALALYGYGYNYNQLPGSAPSNVGDPSLTWELNKPFNVGIDVSILKNRVSFTAEYYKRKSEDLLLAVPLSRTTGFASATRNIGAMENKGLELTVNVIPVLTKNWKWDVDFNFANNKNTITSLPGGSDIADGNFIIRQGAAYKTYYLRTYVGADPANGDPLWYTDGTKTATTNTYANATRTLVGGALPKAFGSLTNALTYKQFTLSAQLYYNFGNYVYDTWGSYYAGAGFGPTYGKVARVLDAWKKPGDITLIPKYIANGNKSFNSASTMWYNQGDYIRLRDIQLGYSIPKDIISKFHLSNANFYVRGTNLFTWVKDKDLPFDPEQGTTSSTNLNVFIPKTVTVGVNLAF
jgi:TonB-linked SusC/RagA family outer membrane protein